jgi:hypothetical protein
MKKRHLAIVLFFSFVAVQSQDTEKKIQLGLFTPHWDDFEYVNGPVKAIHYQAYHISDKDGEVVVGNAFTIEEAENVDLRLPWSFYFDKKGNLICVQMRMGEGNIWTGVVHSANDKVENIYWVHHDSLMINWDYVYEGDGKIQRLWKMYPDQEVTQIVNTFTDKDGNVSKQVSGSNTVQDFWTNEYTRDPDGKLVETKGIDQDGKVKHHFTDFKYNDQGLYESEVMKILNYEEIDQPGGGTLYKFDEHGNWVKRIHPDWMMIERKFEYYE